MNLTMVGSTQVHVTNTAFRGVNIPLPPLLEQHAISEALDNVDALIGHLERLMIKKQAIKQGAMQSLLTGRQRLPGFTGDWKEERLGEIASIIDPHPSHRAPPITPVGIPFVGIGDIDESGNLVNPKVRKISHSILQEHALRYNFSEGLIGFGRVASIGKIIRFKKNSVFTVSPTIAILKPTHVNTDFLYFQLASNEIQKIFLDSSNGSTRRSVGMGAISLVKINLPSILQEQEAIASVLSDMDAELAALQQRLSKTRALKQGMMQELLTGRIRLVDNTDQIEHL